MSLPGLGWMAGGSLLLAVVAGFGGYSHGLGVGRDRAEAEQRKAVDRANAERDRLRTQIENAALLHLQADQQRQTINREIVRESSQIVERPVYRTQCVDADGVRLLDRAAAAANGHSGAPAGAATGAAQGAPVGGGNDRGAVPGQPD